MWNIGRPWGSSGGGLHSASPARAWHAPLPGALPASAPGSSSGDAAERHTAELRAEDFEQMSAAHLEQLVQTMGSPTPDILASLLDDDAGGAWASAPGAGQSQAVVGAPALPAVIRLNVGGRLLASTAQTLRRDRGSRLAMMFGDEPRMRPPRDPQGHFCIDRDGRLFHHVLNFLRDGSPPIGLNRSLRLQLLREADFYGLGALHAALGGTLQPRDLAAWGPPAAAAWEASRASYTRCGTATGLSRPGARFPPPPAPSFWLDAASADFAPPKRTTRLYVRLRFGSEYSGDWIVSSPRQLSGVDYQLHSACIARSPIEALNKMCQAGFKPCQDPPSVPKVDDFHTENWVIAMFRDVDSQAAAVADDPLGNNPGVFLRSDSNQVRPDDFAEQRHFSQPSAGASGEFVSQRGGSPTASSYQRHRAMSNERLTSRACSDLDGASSRGVGSARRP